MAEPLIGPRALIEKMEELADRSCGVPGQLLESKMDTAANWQEQVGGFHLPPKMIEAMRRAFMTTPRIFPLRPSQGDILRSACRHVREQGKTLAGTKEWKRLQRHRRRTGDRAPLYFPIYSSEVEWRISAPADDRVDALRSAYSTLATATHIPIKVVVGA